MVMAGLIRAGLIRAALFAWKLRVITPVRSKIKPESAAKRANRLESRN